MCIANLKQGIRTTPKAVECWFLDCWNNGIIACWGHTAVKVKRYETPKPQMASRQRRSNANISLQTRRSWLISGLEFGF